MNNDEISWSDLSLTEKIITSAIYALMSAFWMSLFAVGAVALVFLPEVLVDLL